MKRSIKCFILFAVAFVMTVSIAAEAIVSPALNILAKKNTMIKSGLTYSDIYFSEQDFKKCLGVSGVDSVKVISLPEAAEGNLKLGSLNVTVGQRISSEYLSLLRFTPASDSVYSSEMCFEVMGTEIPCTVKFLDKVNYAPTFFTDDEAIKTFSQVSCYGSIRATDPEGDDVDLQIVCYPEHGTLYITDAARGSYKYTPSSNFKGKDEFVVVARDSYGNYSSVQTVSVDVEKASAYFTDAKGHWCENAALSLYEKGAIEVVTGNDGLVFCPEEKISRQEFVATVMKALEIDTITDTETSFADNSQIDVRYRPYIATAERMGYISGKDIDGLMCFAPEESITKAEAAVVINNIIGFEEGEYVMTFADDGAIPTWAKTAVYALTSAGVFNGNGEGEVKPSAILSRAEAAQMLYNIP